MQDGHAVDNDLQHANVVITRLEFLRYDTLKNVRYHWEILKQH